MHPLDGPLAKVERGKRQIVALQDEVQRLIKRNPYFVAVAEPYGKAGYYNLRVQGGLSQFPDEWGVLIGEIAHNLRSALDGLAWQLALLDCSKPHAHTAFPICRVGRGERRRRDGRILPTFWESGRPRLRSIKAKFWTRIESFQPYKGRNGRRYSPLWLLEELNIIDKHRLITVVVPTSVDLDLTDIFGPSTVNFRVPLYPNAKVGHFLPPPEDRARWVEPYVGGIGPPF